MQFRPKVLLVGCLVALSAPAQADVSLLPVQSKWAAELYGFAELDAIHDSTQSYSEAAGNGLIARPGTYGAGHGRFMLGIRNSRLGFRLAAPEFFQLKASGVVEMDFLGNQPAGVTEAQFFNNPAFRARRLFLKLEDPYVDVLAGQEWQLFGWQTYFHPNSVEIQGVPGQVYSRTPQVRLSHTFRTPAVNIEIAAAIARPPQRNAEYPDGQAGVRMLVNQWRGIHTTGSTGTSEDAAGIGLSGLVRKFNVPAFAPSPTTAVSTTGWGVSADVLLPILPRTKGQAVNALTFTGSYVLGAGISDQYTGLTGGLTFPALPSGAAYAADVDNGLVTFDDEEKLRAIQWQSFIVGLQYYLPPTGNLWVSVNYSQMDSANARSLGKGSAVIDRIQWADANLFWDVIPAVRLGLEYSWTAQRYGDRVNARNDRVQFSAFYLF